MTISYNAGTISNPSYGSISTGGASYPELSATVLDSSGNEFVISNRVLSSNNSSFWISPNVLDSDGNGFILFN